MLRRTAWGRSDAARGNERSSDTQHPLRLPESTLSNAGAPATVSPKDTTVQVFLSLGAGGPVKQSLWRRSLCQQGLAGI